MFLPSEMVKTKTKPKVRVVSRKVKMKVKNCWTEEDLSECMNFNLHRELLFMGLLKNMVLVNEL